MRPRWQWQLLDDTGVELDRPSSPVFTARFDAETWLGEHWRGYQDIDPGVLTRERILDMLSRFRPEMLLAVTPHGTPKQIAQIVKSFVDAGLRVPKILDYGGMAGLKFAASSAQKVREAEDELMKLCGDIA